MKKYRLKKELKKGDILSIDLGDLTEEVKGKWKPEMGDIYYFIDANGHTGISYNNGYKEDMWRIASNNCFQTIEELKKHQEKLLLINKIKEKLNFEQNDNYYYYILAYETEGNYWRSYAMYGSIRFSNEVILANKKEDITSIIEEYGDKLNILL